MNKDYIKIQRKYFKTVIEVNVEDRRDAEFTDDEIKEMLRQYGMGSLAESGAAI